LEQFRSLPREERLDWLAYEYQRQKRTEEIIEQILKTDKPVAEVITAQILIALLRML
jgi:phage tail protein X